MFLTGFDSVEHIESSYNAAGSLEGATVHFAAYETGDYDGTSFVLFSKGGKLFEVNAGHCSCYGLEDQWSPEETTLNDLYNRWFAPGRTPLVCQSEEASAALRHIVLGHHLNNIIMEETDEAPKP